MASTGTYLAGTYLAYVGCRTSRERHARGDGISVYSVDAATGVWAHIQLVGDLLNPSFLALDAHRRTLYTVHGDASEISAFRVDPDSGRLAFLNRQTTNGRNPVHLVIDPTQRFVVVANHVTAGEHVSSLAVLPLSDDGSLAPLCDHVPIRGEPGPHRVEQPYPKPHQVQYDRTHRFIAVPDKGLDQVYAYELDGEGRLHAARGEPAIAREGAGPRHISFHPTLPCAYAINELDSTVMALRVDETNGALAPFQVVPALPDTFVGHSRAAEIEVSPDGRFVYASNRGHDSIALFSVEAGTGRLTSAGWQASGGRTPRFFAISPDGRFLFVANEDSDTIVTFARDAATGTLRETGHAVRTGSPVCIVFHPIEQAKHARERQRSASDIEAPTA